MIIKFSKTFKKQYEKIPKEIREVFKEKMTIFLENEFSAILRNHKLHGEYSDFRSINITGDYRLVYKKESETVILLIAIGTHAKLYK